MIKAVIFDMDGVLVNTDELHYRTWKALAKELGITSFTKEDNMYQRGVNRLDALEVVLKKTDKTYTQKEKQAMADKKNAMYVDLLASLSPENLLPGVCDFISFLKGKGIKIALGSSSKNAPFILEKTGLIDTFDAVSCGLDTPKSKPNPEVFLIAVKKLGVSPGDCLVVEDSYMGIEGAKRSGMKTLAVGAAADSKEADYAVFSLDMWDYKNNELFM